MIGYRDFYMIDLLISGIYTMLIYGYKKANGRYQVLMKRASIHTTISNVRSLFTRITLPDNVVC